MMHISFHRRRPGMTTMEMLVAGGIMSILATGGLALMVGTVKGYDTGGSKSESDTAASLAIQKIAREVVDGKSATVDGTTRLVVQMPLVNDQGCYDKAFDGDIIAYQVNNGNLERQVNGGAATILGKGVSNVTFAVSGGTISLSTTGQAKSGRTTMQTQFAESVTLRNREIQ